MAITRRELLTLAAAGAAAAAAGLLVGPLVLQKESGAADLLAASFTDLTGKPKTLRDWSGRVLLCNFWATWCTPCRDEIPMLVGLREKYVAKGLEIVGVAVDSMPSVVQFMKETPISYPVLVGGFETTELLRKLGDTAGGLPYTVLLDRNGAIAYRKLGEAKEPELEAQLQAVL
jgi:thiol-disulfide isomerase/thioredoxin